MARASAGLLSLSTGPIRASLLLGAFNETALRIPLGTFLLDPALVLPSALAPAPKAWEVERYSLMPEMHWIFREGEKQVGAPLAFVGFLFVLAPWFLVSTIVRRCHLSPPLHILTNWWE
jgi:oligosaccharyltransferase complex subunit delta (ribophorin II)